MQSTAGMLAKSWYLAPLLAISLVPACGVEDPNADEWTPADPSDFDSKADGISSSSPAVLALIDGAHQRLFAQIPSLVDTTLLTHLKNAAQRGVDVHVYVVVPQPGHPATVLASEQLEATGVDITVERTTRLPGFLAIGDDKMLVGTKTTTGPEVAKAATKFTMVTAEDVSGALPALGSDQTALMRMPEAGAGPIVSLIAGASTSIDLEIYQLQSPATIAALAAAQHRGVAVRVMLEPKTVGAQNYIPAKALLSAAGISVAATPPAFDSSHNVDHAKFMIVDGRELVFGSGNMVRSGLGGNPAQEFDNRDFWIRDRRSGSVSEAQKLFDADWSRKSTTSTTWSSLVLTPDNADAKILALIDGAHTRLYVYNQSLKDATLQQHLIDAKHNGVDVRVLLGNQPMGTSGPAVNQPAIDALKAAGIPAALFTTHYLHGKVIVADGQAFVGSQNFTSGGLGNNRELGEILPSTTIVDALAKGFLVDQAKPNP